MPKPVATSFDIVSRIAERSGQLRPAEQKVAAAVLHDLPAAASAPIGELARVAGVSIASVTRFAKAMGCRDVREFKFRLAQAVAVGERFLHPADQAGPADGIERRAPQQVRQASAHYGSEALNGAIVCDDIHAVLELNRDLHPAAVLEQAAQLLLQARMIYCFGMGGGSTMLADEARYRLVRLARPAATYHDALLQRMVAATLDKNDVLLVFSVTGNVPELLANCEVAREYGARIVAISALGSPLAAMADVLLPVRTLETDLIFKPSSSRYAMLMALDRLMLELALAQKDRSREALRRLKYVLDMHRLPDGPRSDAGDHDRQPLGD